MLTIRWTDGHQVNGDLFGLRRIEDYKSFLARRIGEMVVKGNYFQRRRPPFGGRERSGQLQRIAGTQRMYTEKSRCRFPDFVTWSTSCQPPESRRSC